MSFICIVCRDLFSNKREVVDGAGPASSDIVVTKCGHLYHLACLEDWFNRQLNPRQECPYCKTVLPTNGHQRIFPSEDEETEEINEKMKDALKASRQVAKLKGKVNQLESTLDQTGQQFEEANLTLDILRYEYVKKVSELEEIQSQQKELELAEVVDKLTKEKAELEQKVESMEGQLVEYQQQQDQKENKSNSQSVPTKIVLKKVTL